MGSFSEIERRFNDAVSRKAGLLRELGRAPERSELSNIVYGELVQLRLSAMEELSRYTGRNVICYVSGWLQNPASGPGTMIADNDMAGFMEAVAGMDRSKGVDLLLHTPGGVITATESIVNYLRHCFGSDVRAIVPHLAMSAGTMIACSCKEIFMGYHSSLGPIDPQHRGMPTQGVLKEFDRAMKETLEQPGKRYLWGEILKQYVPTLIGECENIVKMSYELAGEWLRTGMFKDDPGKGEKAEKVLAELGSHDFSKVHDRHYGIDDCLGLGLRVTPLEKDQRMQDLVLSLYHAYMLTLGRQSGIGKIIENSDGKSYIIGVGDR